MMKFPYAIRDFYALITEGYYYLDRTDRIPIMERLGKELLFLRPHRFGKSLWLSTLMNYAHTPPSALVSNALFGKKYNHDIHGYYLQSTPAHAPFPPD